NTVPVWLILEPKLCPSRTVRMVPAGTTAGGRGGGGDSECLACSTTADPAGVAGSAAAGWYSSIEVPSFTSTTPGSFFAILSSLLRADSLRTLPLSVTLPCSATTVISESFPSGSAATLI